jgi:hypothetical protein
MLLPVNVLYPAKFTYLFNITPYFFSQTLSVQLSINPHNPLIYLPAMVWMFCALQVSLIFQTLSLILSVKHLSLNLLVKHYPQHNHSSYPLFHLSYLAILLLWCECFVPHKFTCKSNIIPYLNIQTLSITLSVQHYHSSYP